jgi:hypothetical protein
VRLAPLLKAELATVVNDAEARQLLPRAHDPAALRLPVVAVARPFDGEPLAFVNGPPAAGLDAQLVPLLAEDGRGRVVLSLTREEPAANFVAATAEARKAAAEEVALAVGMDARVPSTTGDYWKLHAPSGHVLRLGFLPVAVATASRAWHPANAALGLRLLVGPRRWRLVSPKGAFPAVELGEDVGPAVARLRAQLGEVASAFPDESGLVITPEASVTIDALAAALGAAEWTEAGAPLFAVALDTATPPTGNGDLAARVARRAAVKVTVTPAELGQRAAAVRRCAQEAVDRGVAVAGALVIEAGQVTAGPADAALRTCVVERLGLTAAMPRAEVMVTN